VRNNEENSILIYAGEIYIACSVRKIWNLETSWCK